MRQGITNYLIMVEKLCKNEDVEEKWIGYNESTEKRTSEIIITNICLIMISIPILLILYSSALLLQPEQWRHSLMQLYAAKI